MQSVETGYVSKDNFGKLMSKIIRQPEFVISVAIIFLTLIVTIKEPTFISAMNLISIMNYVSFTGMVAVPLVFLLVAKMLDMSIGAVVGFLSAVLAVLTKNLGLHPIISLCAIILIGVLIGYINGFLIANLKINAFILTLAMMFFYRGLMQVLLVGRNMVKLPEALVAPAKVQILGLSLNMYMFFIIAIAGWFLLQKTAFGKSIYIIGNNDVIATTSGINREKNIRHLYMMMGIVCAICAYFITLQYRVANISTGLGWEFEVTSGCMLGGCSMYGGKGTILGGLLGIVFMTVLRYALQAFNIVSGYQVVVTGFILIVSVLIDTIRTKKISG